MAVVPTYNPIARQLEARRSEVQGHLQLYGEFNISLGYIRLRLKQM